MKFSIEIYPPKESDVAFVTNSLVGASADHISVTYGAGGSTSRDRSVAVISRLCRAGVPTAAHITIANQSKETVDETLDRWNSEGVRRFVALRGDGDGPGKPFAPDQDGYTSSLELIEKIARYKDVEIAVAAYPNGHADSRGLASDIDYLKAKQDAGATEAITQFFFEPDAYLRFRDACVAQNVSIPVIPGILPVFDFAKVSKFANQCGEPIPEWLARRFHGLDFQPELRQNVAIATTATMCETLHHNGVERIHLYSCNQVNLAVALAHFITFPAQPKQAA